MEVELSPITAADLAAVGGFLHFNLNRRMSPQDWAASIRAPWTTDPPNHGFLLRAGDTVVGAYVAYYSERMVDGRPERFCNLGPWCVLPAHRRHSLRLLRALLAQPGYHFTDLSPGSQVMALNRRLGFEALDTTTAVTPHLPWPSWPGRGRVICDPATIERQLTGRDLEIYRDHARSPAARHLLLVHDDQACHVVYRKDRRKQLRRLVFMVSILHVSDPGLFHRLARPLARHLLLHHGALGNLAELRVVGRRPRGSWLRPDFRPKMFRSPHLPPGQVDNLYSELVCVPW